MTETNTMTEKKVLVLGIKPLVNAPTAAQGQKNNQGWSQSDSSFRFNFLPEGVPAQQEVPVHSQEKDKSGSTTFTGQGSGFTFNFQIPEATQGEMKALAASPSGALASDGPKPATEEVPPHNHLPVSSKAKKKKKSGQKKKASGGTEGQQRETSSSSAIEEAYGDDGTASLCAEEQLKRELDWCMEQLELGMNTHKCSPKQKEQVSGALRTLRSSKASLVKKRQVMRMVCGDYRHKMEEEKDKQFKLIQAAVTSAQVKTVSEPAKKSVFHRRADGKTQNTTENNQQGTLETQTEYPSTSMQNQEGTSTFVFTSAKKQFCFNFL